jgi:hypothetical protein
MAERYQLPRSCVPPTTRRKGCGHPPSGGSEGGKTRCIREHEDMVAFQGGRPPFKGDSPYLRPQPSWAESSPTRSKVLPYGVGAGPHASCKPAQGGRSQTAAHGACNRPAVTSVPPLSPRPAGERAGSHAGGMQPRQVGAPLQLPARPVWRPRPTRHATGAPDATCEQLHRHSRSRRQPSLCPIRGQRENPLSRREDDAPVFRSSNGSRTRNGRPTNRTPRRINSAAGQAAPLAREASDASPSP